ncbi:MAG: elongation factor P maturation arginine rhamnosyltransferase EarP, partial [Betaproteobacteria bacterium]
MSLASQTWVIFCRVVDHFGDAGFCWRLAVALKRLGIGHVVLVIDQLSVLEKLRGKEPLGGVSLLSWSDTEARWNKSGVPSSESADVVIEAFACEIPEAYVRSLGSDCQWITLDYLATEPWADQVHGKPSPLPRSSHPAALKRRWFIPGFSAATGGLLHGSWRHLSTQERRLWRHRLTGESIGDDVFLILAFGYLDADWEFFSNEQLRRPKGFKSVRL